MHTFLWKPGGQCSWSSLLTELGFSEIKLGTGAGSFWLAESFASGSTMAIVYGGKELPQGGKNVGRTGCVLQLWSSFRGAALEVLSCNYSAISGASVTVGAQILLTVNFCIPLVLCTAVKRFSRKRAISKEFWRKFVSRKFLSHKFGFPFL